VDLYSRKQRWKLVLALIAMAIVGASLWYSNRIVNKVRVEERKKVELWAEAVKSRAQLVNYTDSLVHRLREEDRKKVEPISDYVWLLMHAMSLCPPFAERLVFRGVKDLSPDAYKKGITVVFFYPKADTPGCTKQSCSLRDAHGELELRVMDRTFELAAANDAFYVVRDDSGSVRCVREPCDNQHATNLLSGVGRYFTYAQVTRASKPQVDAAWLTSELSEGQRRRVQLACQLAPPADDLRWGRRVCAAAVRHGVLLRPLGDVVVLMPPLTVTSEEIHEIVRVLVEAIAEGTA
jgi:hypothetical protein